MGSILLNHAMLYMLIWLDITCGAYKITTKLNFFYFPCICQLIQVFLGNYENNKHVHNHSWNGQDDFSFQIPISNWNSFWMSNFFKFNLRCILFVVHITTFIFFPNVILLKLSHQSNDFFMQCICTYLWQCFNIEYGLQIQIEPIHHK